MKKISILLFILSSCVDAVNQKDRIVTPSENYYTSEYLEISKKIISEGDTNLYQSFFDTYDDDLANDRLLPYSLIMANKFHYIPAFYHVFEILASVNYETDISMLDHDTKEFAISYFKKAVFYEYKYASKKLIYEFCDSCYTPIKELYMDTLLVKKAVSNLGLNSDNVVL